MTTTTAFIQKSPEAPTPAFTGYVAGIATIDAGETATLAIPCGGRSVVRIGIPTITSANLTFTVTPYAGATARTLKAKDGTTVTVTAGTGGFVAEIPELSGAFSFTIISSASQVGGAAFDIQCVGTNPGPFEVSGGGGDDTPSANNPNIATFVKPNVTTAGSSGAWTTANSPITIATVSGVIAVRAYGVVTTNFTSTAGTGVLTAGFAGATNVLMGNATANGTQLQAGYVWGSNANGAGVASSSSGAYLRAAGNVILTIATNNMTAGGMTIYFEWYPITAGATLTVATP